MISMEQWNDFARDGYLHLGKVLEPDQVEALKDRADALAMGSVVNPQVVMQLDTGGDYDSLPGAVSQFAAGTRLYRKIQGLEHDDLYIELVKHPVFVEACATQYGRHAAISVFRAMIMNKPAGQGTYLPWHQDGGDVWGLDRDPLLTFWVALDPATKENGCMDVIPGSHRLGLLSLFGSTISDENVARHCPPSQVMPLEVPAGHAVMISNWLIHRSGINPSSIPRRAFTMSCMDARTRNVHNGQQFPVIWGDTVDRPAPFVGQMQVENAALRESLAIATEYAKSLEAECRKLQIALESKPAPGADAGEPRGGLVADFVRRVAGRRR